MQPASRSRSMQSAELVENDFVLGWFAKAVDTLAQEIVAAMSDTEIPRFVAGTHRRRIFGRRLASEWRTDVPA